MRKSAAGRHDEPGSVIRLADSVAVGDSVECMLSLDGVISQEQAWCTDVLAGARRSNVTLLVHVPVPVRVSLTELLAGSPGNAANPNGCAVGVDANSCDGCARKHGRKHG